MELVVSFVVSVLKVHMGFCLIFKKKGLSLFPDPLDLSRGSPHIAGILFLKLCLFDFILN